MIVISVDPGLTGAVCVLDQSGIRALFEVPTMQDPSVGPTAMVQRKVDGRALTRALLRACPIGSVASSVVEAVRVIGGDQSKGKNNAIQTQGSLLRSLGAIENVLECLGWPPAYVSPQVWKGHYGLIQRRGLLQSEKLTPAATKRKALERARILYPQCNEIALAKDHNKAEALLMAHWHRERVA